VNWDHTSSSARDERERVFEGFLDGDADGRTADDARDKLDEREGTDARQSAKRDRNIGPDVGQALGCFRAQCLD